MLGRREERSAIDAVLEAARGGRSGALVIRGDAGMGKTTLLEHAAASADEMSVARISGIEAETEFGFAALQRLFIPFMGGLDRLPITQRSALGAAFGLVAGPPADRFLVGLAALTVLADAASDPPLVCLVDDAQWLDRESLDALAFVGRRLFADRIALLFAVRSSPETRVSLAGLPVLQVDGLPETTALELLDSIVSAPVDPQVARTIVAETGGCPLALTELAGGLTSEALAGAGVLPNPLPISNRLETHFLAQVRRLPDDTQRLTLLAAAETTGDPAVLWRAAEVLGVTPAAADPAEAMELLTLAPRVEFRHPLVRSAVYGGASAADRRRIHAALAAVTDQELDPGGRAWHLAAAALGPDEDLAAELERGARRARSQGHYGADAALLSRSAELTPEPGEKARRLLTAAQLHHVAGAPNAARTLLDQATPQLHEPLLRAQATRLDAALNAYTVPARIPSVLLTAARALEDLDVRLARDTYAEALVAALVSGQLTRHTTPESVARAAMAAPPTPDPEPTIADLMIDAFATRLGVGYVAAVLPLRRVVAALCADDTRYSGFGRWSSFGSVASSELWDADGSRTMLLRLEQSERERGALTALRGTLATLADCEMWAGNFATSEARYSECTDIAVALGDEAFVWDALKVELFGWQGRAAETRSIVEVLTTAVAADAGAGVLVNKGQFAVTVLELGEGAYDAALAHAWPMFEDDVPPHGTRVLPDLVEAAIRSGHRGRAEAGIERLTERAGASATPWALGLLARANALMAPDDEAEAHYRDAIAQLGRTYVRTDLARAHLLYGEWLRRQNRRLDAREELRVAHDMFGAMGAQTFAERARSELAATGARAQKRTVETSNILTPQEAQVAGLAATGATNGEIAATLFLSASTIDYHLRKVYRKLGVSSRRKLRQAMPDSDALIPQVVTAASLRA